MTLFKKSLAIVVCTLTLTSAFSHDDQQYSEQIVKSFSVNKNTQLQIENTNGKVEIEAWDNDEIVVTAIIYAHDKAGREKVTVALLQKGDTIDIDTHYEKQSVWNNYNSARVDYFINVPLKEARSFKENFQGDKYLDDSLDTNYIESDYRTPEPKNYKSSAVSNPAV